MYALERHIRNSSLLRWRGGCAGVEKEVYLHDRRRLLCGKDAQRRGHQRAGAAHPQPAHPVHAALLQHAVRPVCGGRRLCARLPLQLAGGLPHGHLARCAAQGQRPGRARATYGKHTRQCVALLSPGAARLALRGLPVSALGNACLRWERRGAQRVMRGRWSASAWQRASRAAPAGDEPSLSQRRCPAAGLGGSASAALPPAVAHCGLARQRCAWTFAAGGAHRGSVRAGRPVAEHPGLRRAHADGEAAGAQHALCGRRAHHPQGAPRRCAMPCTTRLARACALAWDASPQAARAAGSASPPSQPVPVDCGRLAFRA